MGFSRVLKRTKRQLRNDPRADFAMALGLAQQGDPRAVTLLMRTYFGGTLERYGDPDEATEAVISMGEGAVEPLLEFLGRRDTAGVASDLLVELHPHSLEPVVASLEDPKRREAAVHVLAAMEDARAVQPLAALAANGHKEATRRSAVWALGCIGHADGLEAVLAATNDRDKAVRSSAAYALGSIGDNRAVQRLRELLQDSDDDIRRSSAMALEKLGAAEAIPELLQLLRRDAARLTGDSGFAAHAIATAGEPGIEALVRVATTDPDPKVRDAARWGFTKTPAEDIKDERIIRALAAGLSDPEAHWTQTLVNARVRLAADLVMPYLDDPDERVRAQAIRAIWAHSDDDVVDKLADLLENDPSDAVRAAAAWGLGVSHTKRAEDRVRSVAQKNAETELGKTCEKTLEWITHDGPPPSR